MKGIYLTIELCLTASLIYFGDKVGTNNMWLIIAVIIITHAVHEVMFNIYKQQGGKENKSKRNIKDIKQSTDEIKDDDSFEMYKKGLEDFRNIDIK